MMEETDGLLMAQSTNQNLYLSFVGQTPPSELLVIQPVYSAF